MSERDIALAGNIKERPKGRIAPMDLKEMQRYHTGRREKNVTVTFEKSTTPMIWLDTSVLIDFAKIQVGENIESVRAERLSRLWVAVRKAVRDEKLICPEWDQANEFEAKRFEKVLPAIVTDLSCGAHCEPYAGVKDRQIFIGLKAYSENADAMHIPTNIHFSNDPLEAIREAKRKGYIVDAELPKVTEWIEKAKQDKFATQEAVEELRQAYTAQVQTFEQQLALERFGQSDSMMAMVDEYMKLRREGKVTFWKQMGVDGFFLHMEAWRRFGGPSGDLETDVAALYSFMRSPYYWELPLLDISCRLSADLVVKHFPIRTGDSADIQHLSMAIPVAHYVVADKAMVDRCERHGIGEKWNTKLFATRTLDVLSDEIENL